ncbi:MAG: hypothetical protein JNK54_01160 [Elusimicrobia bacterium]|nr:hypothetical protein [Elusimicrobiota bacterium]
MIHRKRRNPFHWVLGVILLFGLTAWEKIGLAVRFPEIEMENVKPGSVINLRQVRGVPYVVINGSDHTVDVQVLTEIPVPGPAEAKKDYEPIPNPDWLRVVPNRFKLGPGDLGSAEVILAVPNDPGLVGRHFQVNIHASADGQGMFSPAVNNYIRFTVGGLGPQSAKKEKKRVVLGALDLDITPPVIRLDQVPLGKTIALKDLKGVQLKLTNRGNEQVKLKLKSVKLENNQREAGWDTPDPSWLKFKPSVMKIKPDQVKATDVTITLPDIPENRGKKFLFLIQAEMAGMDFPLDVYSRVFVTTE